MRALARARLDAAERATEEWEDACADLENEMSMIDLLALCDAAERGAEVTTKPMTSVADARNFIEHAFLNAGVRVVDVYSERSMLPCNPPIPVVRITATLYEAALTHRPTPEEAGK